MAAKKKKKSNKVIKYRKPLNINVGMMIFAIIFLYIVFSVYTYLTRDQIKFYEVLKGSIVKEEQYTGIALREETVMNADASGYLHYYIQEGRRVAVGSRVYTIDESGTLQSYLAEHPELTAELDDEQIKDIRSRLSSFALNFDDIDFSRLYDTKYSLDAAAMEYSSISSTMDLDSVLGDLGMNFVDVTAPVAGVVSYAIDGMEDLNDSSVNAEMFTMNGYKKNITKPGALVDAGSGVYKIITSSTWNIIFPVTDEQRLRYQDVKRIQIQFKDNGIVAPVSLSIYTAQDGNNYGKITLDQYMESFCSDRYISFEIVTDQQIGLKIPVTAVTTKDFYVIPKEFKVVNEETGSEGFYRQVVSESGTSTEFVETTIYKEDEQYCYIGIPEEGETAVLKGGDFVQKQGTSQNYQIGPTGQIEGVYNINKGYAVFRQIERIESNNEYIIVRQATSYGIAVYDHIVLDAATVYEGELIYQ